MIKKIITNLGHPFSGMLKFRALNGLLSYGRLFRLNETSINKCAIPLVFGLLRQHVSTELHFLNFSASHHSKDLLNLFESCPRTL